MRVRKNWEVRAVKHFNTRYGDVTQVLLRNVKTGRTRVKKIDGRWTSLELGL